MSKKNFWHLQMWDGLQSEKKLEYEEVLNTIKNHKIVGLGESEGSACKDFKEKMKIGDIVFVRHNSNPVALVEITGGNEHFKQGGIYHNQREVKILE